MNETPEPGQTPRDMSLSCLVFLEYALAGDMESIELLGQLSVRWRNIPWNDLEFISFAEQMRGDKKLSPFTDNENSSHELRAFAAAIVQRNAELSETISSTQPMFRASAEALRNGIESLNKINDLNAKLFDYIHKMTDLHRRTRDQLELLGADVSPYTLPELPEAPT